MGYHRNNWRQVAGAAAPFVPGGRAILGTVDAANRLIDKADRRTIPYVRGGRPLVELPWQPPGPPPDPHRADAVGRQVWDLLFSGEQHYGARALLDHIGNLLMPLPPAELDLVVRRFGQQGLDRWDALTHVKDADGRSAYDWRRQQELFGWLLRSVSPCAAMLIGTAMPCSQPDYEPDCTCGEHGWVLPQGPFAQVDGAYFTERWQRVSGSTEAMSWQDVDQGRFGTCWLLTSVQAVIQANPHHAPRHLRQEANGTVTCTLYDQGLAGRHHRGARPALRARRAVGRQGPQRRLPVRRDLARLLREGRRPVLRRLFGHRRRRTPQRRAEPAHRPPLPRGRDRPRQPLALPRTRRPAGPRPGPHRQHPRPRRRPRAAARRLGWPRATRTSSRTWTWLAAGSASAIPGATAPIAGCGSAG
ncbi:hypothetical protein ACFQ1I_15780 [Kitasatospora arboriphila]